MHILNPVFPAAALCIALLTVRMLRRMFWVAMPAGRISTIDGLRGYLAFFVVMHHAAIWILLKQPSDWGELPSRMFVHFGETSVALFFMITAFLFFTKIMNAKLKPIRWGSFYIARILRLLPLYLVAMAAFFAIVGALSHWHFQVSPGRLAAEVFRWLTFAVSGMPDVNGVPDTFHIVAGVTWSLRYEWAFYLVLPLLALATSSRPPIVIITLSALFAFALFFVPIDATKMLVFVGGLAAAYLSKSDLFLRLAKHPAGSIIATGCLFTVVLFFDTAYSAGAILLLSICFSLIACGNTMFGILTSHTSRAFGDLAYGIYLLHGIVLFVLFRFILRSDAFESMTSLHIWLAVYGAVIFIVVITFITFRYIESPVIKATPRINSWLSGFQRMKLINA